jgi:uncharacterized membrane protein YgaE (UPF0421/DUF939 family)
VQSTKPLKVFTPLTSAEITEKRSQKKYKQLKPIQEELLNLHKKTPAKWQRSKKRNQDSSKVSLLSARFIKKGACCCGFPESPLHSRVD